ncbi:MAG: hypothetical protein GDA53_05490 [Rhodobacteraceae bacterium]|nr:hypothetical protein [Paracoccaceae bacterium]
MARYSYQPINVSKCFPDLWPKRQIIINRPHDIAKIFDDQAFSTFLGINVMPLIYDEKEQKCNILVFDYVAAKKNTARIEKLSSGSGRKHPVFLFMDAEDGYICEVRYGNASANALQRGLWTDTKKAIRHFHSVTNGWIDYTHNRTLVKLFSHALVSSNPGHEAALQQLGADIDRIRKGGLK